MNNYPAHNRGVSVPPPGGCFGPIWVPWHGERPAGRWNTLWMFENWNRRKQNFEDSGRRVCLVGSHLFCHSSDFYTTVKKMVFARWTQWTRLTNCTVLSNILSWHFQSYWVCFVPTLEPWRLLDFIVSSVLIVAREFSFIHTRCRHSPSLVLELFSTICM